MKQSTIYFLITLGLFTSSYLLGQPQDPYPPSPAPDRIILSMTEEPSTTQAVSWRTDTTVTEAFAEIALASSSPEFPQQSTKVKAQTTRLKTNKNTAHFHATRFTDLTPNTQYAYRVGDGTHFSEWIQFTTATKQAAPFSFIYFGDAQNQIKSLWSRCIRQAVAGVPEFDFLLHAGDLVNRPNNDAEWGEWFYAGGWIYGMKPNIATPGNHEYFKTPDNSRTLSTLWRPTFALPENGPEALKETVFAIDYQDVRIISLDNMAMFVNEEWLESQVKWLEEQLQNNPNTWTIITHHFPIYSTASGRDNVELRSIFQPIYEKYGVDIVLQGHDHAYGRGHNLAFGLNQKDKGPVYVVSVSGPKMYNLSLDERMERMGSNTQLYQHIAIDGKRLSFKAYSATGELYDAFLLKKSKKGWNKFIDQTNPLMKEHLELSSSKKNRMNEEEIDQYRKRFEAYKARKTKKP